MRAFFGSLLLCVCTLLTAQTADIRSPLEGIPGSISITEHSLGELVIPESLGAKNVRIEAKTLSWKTFQTKQGSVIVFCGSPGEHTLRITYVTEDYEIHVINVRVVIQGKDTIPPPKPEPKPEPKPDPKPEPKPEPKPKPEEKVERAIQSVVKIRTSYSLCSATLIWQWGDKVTLISAAHCVSREGQLWDVETRAGVKFQAKVVAFDRKSDLSVLQGTCSVSLPVVPLATKYTLGEKVFHCGFGRHIPGNVEYGELLNIGENQNAYSLSVSPGDSGGGIFNMHGEWLGAVCCTTNLDRVGTVWAGNIFAFKRLWSEFETKPKKTEEKVLTKHELIKRFLVHVVAERVVLLTETFEVVLDHRTLVDYVLTQTPDELLNDLADYVLQGGCMGFACDLLFMYVSDNLCSCIEH